MSEGVLTPLCAVKRRRSSVGATPTRHRSLQPVAIGAVVEVTKLPKPSMERVASGDSASRQAVTRVNAEQASKREMWEPTQQRYGEGRCHRILQGSDTIPSCDPTGVMATACLHREIERNTGNPKRWVRDPTGRPRGIGRAAWGVGEAHSTAEAG
jgi:hypothetical protein